MLSTLPKQPTMKNEHALKTNGDEAKTVFERDSSRASKSGGNGPEKRKKAKEPSEVCSLFFSLQTQSTY